MRGVATDRGVALESIAADVPFAITDHDIEGLKIIPTERPQAVSTEGRFRMANGSASLPANLAVQFGFSTPGRTPDSIPADGGAFWLRSTPGTFSVLPVAPPGYAVTELRYGGLNYTNCLIPMNGAPGASFDIVLSDQPATISGSLVDGEQKPIPAKVALVPDPLPQGFDWRAIRVAVTDKDGGFGFTGIAPGRYKAVALTGDERKQDHDLSLLGDKFRVVDAFEVTTGQNARITVKP